MLCHNRLNKRWYLTGMIGDSFIYFFIIHSIWNCAITQFDVSLPFILFWTVNKLLVASFSKNRWRSNSFYSIRTWTIQLHTHLTYLSEIGYLLSEKYLHYRIFTSTKGKSSTFLHLFPCWSNPRFFTTIEVTNLLPYRPTRYCPVTQFAFSLKMKPSRQDTMQHYNMKCPFHINLTLNRQV